jgi:hypothetical protein
MIYLPVKYLGKALMPMKASRVRRFIKEGKARLMFDRKLNQHWLKLLVEPSSLIIQEVVLGIDPGSTFDGFSVVSNQKHLGNWELIQKPKKIWIKGVSYPHKDSIQQTLINRSGNRRLRRSRLWHRPCRNAFRSSSKFSPTHRSNYNFRAWLVEKLLKIYPITKVVVEDVAFNHYANSTGASFSNAEIGKTALYNFIRSKELKLELIEGYTTSKLRINLYGFDPKKKGIETKGDMVFEAHCLDSFVIACNIKYPIDIETGEILIEEPIPIFELENINKKFIAITKVNKGSHLGSHRKLFANGKSRQTKPWSSPKLVQVKKGGKLEVRVNQFSNKENKFRIKLSDHPSNHGPWSYGTNGRSTRKRCFPQIIKQKNYLGKKKVYLPQGGSVKYGKPIFFRENEWYTREIQVF